MQRTNSWKPSSNTSHGQGDYTMGMENDTKAHAAIHLSRNLTRRVLVVQPRRADGTFLSPEVGHTVRTFHVTVNGLVRTLTRG